MALYLTLRPEPPCSTSSMCAWVSGRTKDERADGGEGLDEYEEKGEEKGLSEEKGGCVRGSMLREGEVCE